MSWRAVQWALEQEVPAGSGGGATGKLVLLIIAEHWNPKDGRCWPSRERIAEQAQLDPKSVSRALEVLQDAGLVAVEVWVLQTGQKLGNRYYLPTFADVPRALIEPAVLVVVAEHWDSDGSYVITRASDGVELQRSKRKADR